jgi:hypothetical protein
MSGKPDPKNTININTINIKINTNIPDQPDISLTKKVLVVKTPNYGKYNEYPFITGSIRIRKGILPLSYAERMDFFFMKERFKFLTDQLKKEGGIDTNYVNEAPKPNQTDKEKKEEMEKFKKNITNNINLLLNCVFITYPMMNNIISSKTRRQLDIDTPFLSDRYSYVAVGQQKYTVARVVLIDDIYNHYAFEQLRVNNEEFEIWKINETRNLDKKIEDMVEEQTKLFDSTYKDINYDDDIKKCVQSLSDATNVAGGYVANRRENDIYIRALEDLFKALVLFNQRRPPAAVAPVAGAPPAPASYKEGFKQKILTMLEETRKHIQIGLENIESYQTNFSSYSKYGVSICIELISGFRTSLQTIQYISSKITLDEIMNDDDLKKRCDSINVFIRQYITDAPKMIPIFLMQPASSNYDRKNITSKEENETLTTLKLLTDTTDFQNILQSIKPSFSSFKQPQFKQLYELQTHFMKPSPLINVPQIQGHMKVLGKLKDLETDIDKLNAILKLTPTDTSNTRQYTDFIVRTNEALSSVGQIGISNQTKLLVNALNTNAKTLQKYLNEKNYVILDDNTLRMGIDEYKNEKYKKLSGEINANIKLIQKMINYKTPTDVKAIKTDKDEYEKLIAQLDEMNGSTDECGLIFDNDKTPSYEVYIYLDLIKGQVSDTNNNLNMCGFKDGILKTKLLQEFYGRAKKIEHDPLITLYEPRYQKPTISSNKTRKSMPTQQPKNNTRRQLPTQIPQPQQ